MYNLRKQLKTISFLFYIASLSTIAIRTNIFGIYNHYGFFLLLGIFIPPYGIPAYANIFYIYCLFSSKGNKTISRSALILLPPTSLIVFHSADGLSGNYTVGIGMLYWFISLYLMAYAANLLGDEEIEKAKCFRIYGYFLLLFMIIMSYAALLYSKTNIQERKYYPFGTLYLSSHLTGFDYITEDNTPSLPKDSIIELEGNFQYLRLPPQFIERGKFVRHYNNDNIFIRFNTENLKPDYLYKIETISSERDEMKVSVTNLNNNQVIYQQKLRLEGDAYLSYNPYIIYNLYKLFSHLTKETYPQTEKLKNQKLLSHLEMKECQPQVMKVSPNLFRWQNAEFEFPKNEDSNYRFYCHQDYIGIWLNKNQSSGGEFYLFSTQDFTLLTYGVFFQKEKDICRNFAQFPEVIVQLIIDEQEKEQLFLSPPSSARRCLFTVEKRD